MTIDTKINLTENIFFELETGKSRVAEKINGKWRVNKNAKKSILEYFSNHSNNIVKGSLNNYFDKVPLRFKNYSKEDFNKLNIRVVPPAAVRAGVFIGKNAVIMPSYINIGAHIGEGTMIDSLCTIGSCAQIGNNCHISSNTVIGGVLEPIQATPVIIEDNCFIGANSSIAEGIIVEEGSVISNGVHISSSTKIYNPKTKEISYKIIPKGSVIISGSLPSQCKSYNQYCAVIVKTVDHKTLSKTAINEILRNPNC